jgi:hypothetical protein
MRKLVYASLLQTTKQGLKMAESKAILFLLNLIGIPLYGYTLFINIDNLKGWVLTGMAVCMGALKLYFMYKKGRQALREKEYQLWELEREKRRKDRQETSN